MTTSIVLIAMARLGFISFQNLKNYKTQVDCNKSTRRYTKQKLFGNFINFFLCKQIFPILNVYYYETIF